MQPAKLEDPEVERLADDRRRAGGYRRAACRALAFARRYRREEGVAGGEREKACVAQALAWRRAARAILSAKVGPGVVRATPAVPDRIERTG